MESRNIFQGFYRLPIKERRNALATLYHWENGDHGPYAGLDEEIADSMVENCIGSLAIPIGIGCNLRINDKDIIVPMVTEEPSVIAALSGAAKTITKAGGGFVTTGPTHNIITANLQYIVNNNDNATLEHWTQIVHPD